MLWNSTFCKIVFSHGIVIFQTVSKLGISKDIAKPNFNISDCCDCGTSTCHCNAPALCHLNISCLQDALSCPNKLAEHHLPHQQPKLISRPAIARECSIYISINTVVINQLIQLVIKVIFHSLLLPDPQIP